MPTTTFELTASFELTTTGFVFFFKKISTVVVDFPLGITPSERAVPFDAWLAVDRGRLHVQSVFQPYQLYSQNIPQTHLQVDFSIISSVFFSSTALMILGGIFV